MQFFEVVEQFVSLTVGPQYITQGKPQASIDHILSVNALTLPVVCLTHCEGDEERVEEILRDSARDKEVVFHHVELADDCDTDGLLTDLARWSGEENRWVLITYSHLLRDPKTTWSQLTEV